MKMSKNWFFSSIWLKLKSGSVYCIAEGPVQVVCGQTQISEIFKNIGYFWTLLPWKSRWRTSFTLVIYRNLLFFTCNSLSLNLNKHILHYSDLFNITRYTWNIFYCKTTFPFFTSTFCLISTYLSIERYALKSVNVLPSCTLSQWL